MLAFKGFAGSVGTEDVLCQVVVYGSELRVRCKDCWGDGWDHGCSVELHPVK